MKEVRGDIWDFYDKGHWVVITTNGTVRNDGACVMGRGVAKQAADKFPALPYQLGNVLKIYGNIPRPFHEYRIITFPVKYHWAQRADLELIEESCKYLIEGMKMLDLEVLYMVRPGCGNGRRDWETEVKPILEKYLDDRFIVVEKG